LLLATQVAGAEPNMLPRSEAKMTADDTSHEGPDESGSGQDAQIDEVEEESFPASDPPSFWAGRNQDSDD
jgi:hypothetical protein